MAYGLQITGGTNNDILISDSQKAFTSTYTATIGSGTSTSDTFDSRTDLCFFKYTPAANSYKAIYQLLYNNSFAGNSGGNPDNKLYFVDHYASLGTTVSTISVDYVHLKPVDTATIPNTGYGIQIKNSGGDAQFDSRIHTGVENSLYIDAVFERGSRFGNPFPNTGLSIVGSNFSDYFQGPIYNTFNGFSVPIRLWYEHLLFTKNSSFGGNGSGIYMFSFMQSFFGFGGTYLGNNSPFIRAKPTI